MVDTQRRQAAHRARRARAQDCTRTVTRLRSVLTEIYPSLERVFAGSTLTRTPILELLIHYKGPQGRQTRYEIVDAHLAQALNALLDITLAVDDNAECIDAG